jgi:AraC-like DNA-binding protein
VRPWHEGFAKNAQAHRESAGYPDEVDHHVDLSVALPGLQAVRATTTTLHTGVKDRYGVGRIEQGDTEWWGGGQSWRSTPGCILVKQPGDVVRHLRHIGPTTYTAVVFPAADVARLRDESRVVVVPQLDPRDERSGPFHRLLDAVAASADRLSLEVAVIEALDALALVCRARADHTRPVRRAVDYLRERMADPLTLDEIAAFAGLDKFHLCRAFRSQIGLPPHTYLTHLRIARAKELLRSGVCASAIAPQVGFCDQAQLTRHFTRLVGTSPARFGRTPRVFK